MIMVPIQNLAIFYDSVKTFAIEEISGRVEHCRSLLRNLVENLDQRLNVHLVLRRGNADLVEVAIMQNRKSNFLGRALTSKEAEQIRACGIKQPIAIVG